MRTSSLTLCKQIQYVGGIPTQIKQKRSLVSRFFFCFPFYFFNVLLLFFLMFCLVHIFPLQRHFWNGRPDLLCACNRNSERRCERIPLSRGHPFLELNVSNIYYTWETACCDREKKKTTKTTSKRQSLKIKRKKLWKKTRMKKK